MLKYLSYHRVRLFSRIKFEKIFQVLNLIQSKLPLICILAAIASTSTSTGPEPVNRTDVTFLAGDDPVNKYNI